MAIWKAVVLVNLALAIGLGSGYLWGGRHAARLRGELAAARAMASAAGERAFQGQGVIRAILPELNVIVLTHGEIPGYMPPMTMGFRTASPQLLDGVAVGDSVHFFLRGTLPNLVVTGIAKLP
jgi:Cu(I)/Ag(I) efflux system protein CusF